MDFNEEIHNKFYYFSKLLFVTKHSKGTNLKTEAIKLFGKIGILIKKYEIM